MPVDQNRVLDRGFCALVIAVAAALTSCGQPDNIHADELTSARELEKYREPNGMFRDARSTAPQIDASASDTWYLREASAEIAGADVASSWRADVKNRIDKPTNPEDPELIYYTLLTGQDHITNELIDWSGELPCEHEIGLQTRMIAALHQISPDRAEWLGSTLASRVETADYRSAICSDWQTLSQLKSTFGSIPGGFCEPDHERSVGELAALDPVTYLARAAGKVRLGEKLTDEEAGLTAGLVDELANVKPESISSLIALHLSEVAPGLAPDQRERANGVVGEIVELRLDEDGIGKPAWSIEPTLDATYSAFQLAGSALRQNREANTRLLETLGENWLSDPGGADPVALYQAEWVSQQIEPDRYPAGPAVCQKHDAIPHGGGWEAPVAAVATAHLKRAIGCDVSNVEVEPWPVNSMEARAAALSILQFEDLVSNPGELHAAWPNLADDFITALPEYSGPVSLVTSALRASNFRSQFAPEDRADLVAEIMDACESPALGADIFIDGKLDGSLCSIQTASELRMAGMLSW